MARKKYSFRKRFLHRSSRSSFLVSAFIVALVSVIGIGHFVRASSPNLEPIVILAQEDSNFHVETIVRQFFEDNNASEMIPIIKCESNFRQFEADGTPLKNRQGSSAIGVAQIMASKHPDPRIVTRYNRKFDMDMSVDDFDITTLEGNLGYALVLYKVRGVRDWECAKPFHF